MPVPQATVKEAVTELARPVTEFADFSTNTVVTTQMLSSTTTTETADLRLLNFTDVEPEPEDGSSLTFPPEPAARSAMTMKVTKLLINAWYPWNPYGSTFAFVLTYIFQVCYCMIYS